MIIEIKDKLIEVDDSCANLVKYFNSINLNTKFCCEGHRKGENFNIMFQDDITDKQIIDFISKYSNKFNHSPFRGKFVKWVRKMSSEIVYSWIYIAENKYHANRDYELMINLK